MATGSPDEPQASEKAEDNTLEEDQGETIEDEPMSLSPAVYRDPPENYGGENRQPDLEATPAQLNTNQLKTSRPQPAAAISGKDRIQSLTCRKQQETDATDRLLVVPDVSGAATGKDKAEVA